MAKEPKLQIEARYLFSYEGKELEGVVIKTTR